MRIQATKRLTRRRKGPQTSMLRHSRARAPVAFGTGLIALDVILSADPTRAPILAAGGTCANVLTILSFFGWDAFPIARLNGDAASKIVRADLARRNVRLDFSAQRPRTQTPIIIQRNEQTPNRTPTHRFSLTCPGCGAWFPSFRAVTRDTASKVIETVERSSTSGLVPRVFFFDRVSRGALMLAEAFANCGALVVFEPVGVGDPKLFAEALSAAHVLKYSRDRLPKVAERQAADGRLLLEVETLGADGLRYRSKLLATRAWHRLAAVPAPSLFDTAGAGDWCTAGLLAVLARNGVSGAETARASDLAEALRYGQAAATIACGYEGARGAMDALNRKSFHRTLTALLAGERAPRLRLPRDPSETATALIRPAGRAGHLAVRGFCSVCP